MSPPLPPLENFNHTPCVKGLRIYCELMLSNYAVIMQVVGVSLELMLNYALNKLFEII